MRPSARRTIVVIAVAGAVTGAFVLGVVAGAASRPAATGTNDRLDDAAAQISAQALTPVDRATLDSAAIQAMLRAVGDQWGTWTTEQRGPGVTAGYVGIGVWLRTGPRGGVLVAQVSEGSSAGRAGVRPGDEVRTVDGRSTVGLTAPVVAALLRGPEGTSVRVTALRGRSPVSFSLARTAVAPPGVSVTMEQGPDGRLTVGRVVVPVFTRGAGRDVRDALSRLRARHAVGVVLDLRGNPGGLLDEGVETASAFLDGGTVVTFARRDGQQQVLAAQPGGDTHTPLVVLADGGTASAAEVVAGALQDRGRAVVVGSRTFGKGSVQEPRQLADGSALELTVARYRTPSGRNLEGVGLEPDIAVAPGSDTDVAVRRAVEVLTGLVADTAPVTGGRG